MAEEFPKLAQRMKIPQILPRDFNIQKEELPTTYSS
jgi:hypothetical protein